MCNKSWTKTIFISDMARQELNLQTSILLDKTILLSDIQARDKPPNINPSGTKSPVGMGEGNPQAPQISVYT